MTDIGLSLRRRSWPDFACFGRDAARLIAPPLAAATLLFGGWSCSAATDW